MGETLEILARGERLLLRGTERTDELDELARRVTEGLSASPKELPCRFFYDARGSELFERICELEDYYPTRAEDEILALRSDEVVAHLPEGVELVELGSGSSTKTRHLIEALLRRQQRLLYVPIDISRSMLERSARELLREYPPLRVEALACEYGAALEALAAGGASPRLVLWLGSNIGNFDRAEAASFLARLGHSLAAHDRLLIGIDLRKDPDVLVRAYDDAQGVTALFDLNLLERINRELGGGFDPRRFRHRALWREDPGRVEMHLESLVDQAVPIADLGLSVQFRAGETIHTENAYKYSPSEIEALAVAAGFGVERTWTDAGRRFCAALFAPLAG